VPCRDFNREPPPCLPPANPSTKPGCEFQDPGTFSSSPDASSEFGIVMWVFGILGTAASVLSFFSALKAGATYQNCFFVAGVAAFVTWLVISYFYYDHCLVSPRPFNVCSAGVIEATFPAFSSVSDQIFAFVAMHDRIDVVLKSIYWASIFKNAPYINCSPNNELPYDDKSPMISEYYHNDAVCRAGLGGSIGALVGGVAGAFLGALDGLAASLSCGPFAWLCALIALIIAIIVAVVSTVIGAVVGSQIGRAASGPGRPLPTGPAGPDFPSSLSVGDYVTTCGTLAGNKGGANGAYVYWFVDTTYQHGCSPNKPPFSYTDPDSAPGFVIDGCCTPTAPQGPGPLF